jgi:aminoglycoside phosphotransferase (APT) family kinase protein
VIHGAPDETRWIRPEPRRNLPVPVLERMVQTAFPHRRIVQAQPLTDGFRNANFRLQLDPSPGEIVLRIYEHDASLCRKEIDLMRLIGSSVPVPEVIHAEPAGLDNFPPFILMRYVEGISFRDLARSGDSTAIAEAAFAVGETLAGIGRFTFSKGGWLAPGTEVITPLLAGADSGPRFVDLCLSCKNLQARMALEWRDRLHTLMWSWAERLGELDSQAVLVHGDFGKRNLRVRRVTGNNGERWSVAAVLDWEFAISGSPLADIGHFLRYERTARPRIEPHFSQGYLQAGGTLPHDWRRLSRLVDMIALCESLTHDQLPDTVIAELVELIRAAVEDRDPVLS